MKKQTQVDRISGPDGSGTVQVTGKDILKAVDDERALCPFPMQVYDELVGKMIQTIQHSSSKRADRELKRDIEEYAAKTAQSYRAVRQGLLEDARYHLCNQGSPGMNGNLRPDELT